jgi:hypothetical protein
VGPEHTSNFEVFVKLSGGVSGWSGAGEADGYVLSMFSSLSSIIKSGSQNSDGKIAAEVKSKQR